MIPGVRLLILGKQGAGKGTQAVRLARHYVVPHVSTGDLFRTATMSGSEFGKRAAVFMEAGELIPDEVVIGVVRERLAQDDTLHRGFLLDGFPRTRPQAEELERIMSPHGVDVVVNIKVPTELVLQRLGGRRACRECGANYHVNTPPTIGWICDVCGGEVVHRTDDTDAAIQRRLALYEQETRPLIEFYRSLGVLTEVDGVGTTDEVFQRVVDAVDAKRNLVGDSRPR